MPRARFQGEPVQAGTFEVKTKTANYLMTEDDEVILADDTSNSVTISLPALKAGTNIGLNVFYTVKRITAGGNTVTVDTPGSETIDGSATVTIATQYDSIQVVCDATNWHIIGNKS